MRLDHLLAADPLGGRLDDARRQRVSVVLEGAGFEAAPDAWVLDGTYPWVTVSEVEGILHVHVLEGAPGHLISIALNAFDRLVSDCALARIDPLTRREISAMDWSRRVASVQPAHGPTL